MKIALLSSLLLTGLYVNAQPVMVSDINPAGSSNPTWLTDYGNKILFFADDGNNGNELFAYDTAASIQFDINPGNASGVPATNNKSLALIGKDVYFPAEDGTVGMELYKWDGKAAPTLAADIRSGAASSNINELIAFGGKIYFNANNGTNGNELWVYDPATGLPQRLTDLATGGASSDPRNFIIYKDKLYFTAFGTGMGIELYVYDPVSNTTKNALDIQTGTGSSDPQAITLINDKLYFSASTTAFGRELYMYDGKNVSRLTDVDNAPGNGVAPVAPSQTGIISYKGMILFSGNSGINNQLFQYNPVNGVTSLIYLLNPGGDGNPSNFTNYAGKVFFTADNGTQGNELWMYNGTIPEIVADLEPGATGSDPMNLLRYTTNLYFSASTSASGRELYKMLDSNALNIQNVRFNAEVTVAPNPATSVAHINMNLHNNESVAIMLTDVTGRQVYNTGMQQYTAGKHTVDVAMDNMAPGVYIYTLRSSTDTLLLSGRLTKQ